MRRRRNEEVAGKIGHQASSVGVQVERGALLQQSAAYPPHGRRSHPHADLSSDDIARHERAIAYQESIKQQMEEKRQRDEQEKARRKAEDVALERKIMQGGVVDNTDLRQAPKSQPQPTGFAVGSNDPESKRMRAIAYQESIKQQMEEKRQRDEQEKARRKAEDVALERKMIEVNSTVDVGRRRYSGGGQQPAPLPTQQKKSPSPPPPLPPTQPDYIPPFLAESPVVGDTMLGRGSEGLPSHQHHDGPYPPVQVEIGGHHTNLGGIGNGSEVNPPFYKPQPTFDQRPYDDAPQQQHHQYHCGPPPAGRADPHFSKPLYTPIFASYNNNNINGESGLETHSRPPQRQQYSGFQPSANAYPPHDARHESPYQPPHPGTLAGGNVHTNNRAASPELPWLKNSASPRQEDDEDLELDGESALVLLR